MRKEQDLADVCLVRQQHDQPVDPHPEAAVGRHPIAHGLEIVLVQRVPVLVDLTEPEAELTGINARKK